MADDKIIIEFDGDINKLKAKLKTAEKKTLSFGEKAKNLIGKGLKGAVVPTTAAIAGIGVAMGAAVRQAAKFETITTQFKVLTGSALQAKQVVEDLQEFSANTPFQFEGIAKASQQLLGFGYEAEQLVPKLQEIGDVASAVGRPIDEVAFIFGQVSAAGKLTGERLLQFQERAIPIGPAIAKTMGIAEASVKDAVSKGKVDLATFEKAFASLSQEGGFAFEGMIKQSKTFGGLMSTLGDNVSLLAGDIGKELLPAAKQLATGFIELLKSLKDNDEIMQKVRDWGTYITEAFVGSTAKSKREMQRLGGEIENLQKKVEDFRNKQGRMDELSWWDKQLLEVGEMNYKTHLKRLEKAEKEYAEYKKKLAKQTADDLAEIRSYEGEYEAMLAKKKAKETAKIEKEKNSEILSERIESLKIGEEELTEAEKEQKEIRAEILAAQDAETKAKQLESEGKYKEALKLLDDAEYKRKQKFKSAELLLDKQTTTQQINLAQNTANLMNAIAGKQTKIGFLLSKVAAAANVLVADSQARAAATTASAIASIAAPPGANLAAFKTNAAAYNSLITANTAVALGTIAAQTLQGFKTGGLVEGGIAGKDSVGALLQRGEVIVPPQTSFQDIVDAGRAISGDDGAEGSGVTEVVLSFRDNIGEFIEAQILERRSIGIGAV